MKIITAMPGTPVEIGRTGENHAIKVLFQNILPGWKETYGKGLVSMVYKRPKDKHAYPVVCLIENDGADISWIVSRTDLENSGLGKLELIYTVDDTVAISETYPIIVKRSISGEAGSEPPEDPGKTWFENMNDKITGLEKREMIVSIIQTWDENDENPTWKCNHTFEEIKNACIDPQVLVSVQATSHHPKTRVDQDYQNGNAIYFSSRNMIEFTWIYPAKTNSNIPVFSLQMYPDGHFMMATAMLELSSYKDTTKISDSASTDHYPSNKAMTDYVNSQILAGKEIFVVNWTQSPEVCQADKTYAEIKAALENDVVTVVGKTKNDGTTYATHEITIATDGKIYFRFIWCDETRGTMEKYFWLQEDEYGSSVPPKPVSQQDWAENNEASASYVKNRPGGYTVYHTDTVKANEKDFPTPLISLTRIYIRHDVYFGIILMREDISGLSLALENGTVESSENLTWVSGENYYYTNEVFSKAKNEWFPKCVVILKENTTVKGIKFPKIGIYTTGIDAFGKGWRTYYSDFYISWTHNWTEDVKIPLKYIEADHSLGIIGAQVEQIAKITAVDDTGKPTAWGPVDMPSGDSLGAVLYTPQALTDEQKRQARENVEALSNNSVYYTYLPDNHSNDIYKLALSGPIGFITGVGAAGMIPPITVIFGAMDRGIVNTFAIDFHGYMYHTGLSLASASEPVWTKIEQLRLNNNGTLPQQTMASSPTENMQIATKKYVDDHTEESDPTVPEWAKQPHKPSYTAQEIGALPATTHIPSTADDVNAEPSGTVSQHNVSNVAHSDIRILIQGLTDRLNALADSDDTTLDQLSEIVAYIKSNKSLIDAITISKVNVTDIVNDLTTNVANKPLSAAQGIVIKTLIDALRNDKLDAVELTNAVNTALAQAKASGEFDGADGKTAYQYAVEGGYTGTETAFAEKLAQKQLTGTTNDLTPTQVYNAVSAGIQVKVQYLDGNFGIFSYTNFNAAENMKAIAANTIVYYNGVYMLGVLIGNTYSNKWYFMTTTLAQKTDIPTALPNPNAITFTGAVTGTYNGSRAMTVKIPSAVTDDHINSLIDTKLGVIENGYY